MSDDLRRMLADASRAAATRVVPPGADAARRTLRRRRTIRASGLAVLLVVLALVGVNLVPGHPAPVPPLLPTPSAAPSPELSPTPGDLPSPAPTPSVSATPGRGPSPVAVTPTARPLPSSRPALAPSTSPSPSPSPSPPCLQAARPQVGNATTAGPTTFTFTLDPADAARLCPGVTMRVSWAVYRLYWDGVQRLFERYWVDLSAANPVAESEVGNDYGCPGDRYFVIGDMTWPDEMLDGPHLNLPAWQPGSTSGVFEQHLREPDGCF